MDGSGDKGGEVCFSNVGFTVNSLSQVRLVGHGAFFVFISNSLGSTSGAVFLPGLLLAIMGFTFLELLPDNTLQVSTSFGNPGEFRATVTVALFDGLLSMIFFVSTPRKL